MNYRVTCQTDVDFLARKERCKDMLRDVERERLIRTAQLKQPALGSSFGRWIRRIASDRMTTKTGPD
jgi:hypothetical protein